MFVEAPLNAPNTPATVPEPALAEQMGRYVRSAGGAFSENTERAVRSDLAIYGKWCFRRGTKALPASAETIAAFIDAMAETRTPATVRRYVASIAVAHRAIGRGKTVASPPVKLALQRMHRQRGRRQSQAHGLTWPLRQRLLEAAGDRPIDLRNRALLAVAYDAMLRRAELTSLQVTDLLEEMGGSATLLVRRSKTDGEGSGEIVYLACDTVRLVRGVARPERDYGGAAVPLGRQERQARRAARPEPGAAHLQGDGGPGRAAGGAGAGPVGTQRPGRRGPGHDRGGHRAAGDPPGRAVEVHRHGQSLRRAAAGEAQRRGAACPAAGPGVRARGPLLHPGHGMRIWPGRPGCGGVRRLVRPAGGGIRELLSGAIICGVRARRKLPNPGKPFQINMVREGCGRWGFTRVARILTFDSR